MHLSYSSIFIVSISYPTCGAYVFSIDMVLIDSPDRNLISIPPSDLVNFLISGGGISFFLITISTSAFLCLSSIFRCVAFRRHFPRARLRNFAPRKHRFFRYEFFARMRRQPFPFYKVSYVFY